MSVGFRSVPSMIEKSTIGEVTICVHCNTFHPEYADSRSYANMYNDNNNNNQEYRVHIIYCMINCTSSRMINSWKNCDNIMPMQKPSPLVEYLLIPIKRQSLSQSFDVAC